MSLPNERGPLITRRQMIAAGLSSSLVLMRPFSLFAAATEDATSVEPQPYFAAVKRAVESLAKLGEPLVALDAAQLAALSSKNNRSAIDAAEKILDRYTLARVSIGSGGVTNASAGGAQRTLIEQGWRLFLVRVWNPIGNTGSLAVVTGALYGATPGKMSLSPFTLAQRPGLSLTPGNSLNPAPAIAQMWLTTEMFEAPPMAPALSGFSIEYRVIEIFSRDQGPRSSDFHLSTTSNPYGLRKVRLDFDCLPSRNVGLHILDTDGRGCVASLIIKDNLDRIYPLPAMRLAPDLSFQPQIYRADGETVRLPDGDYTIESKRGPEYIREIQKVLVGDDRNQVEIKLKRWVDPAAYGWYSGDTHIHAAGCAHYDNPTEGVSPATIVRHARGEALSIADVLTWGPGYYYQKQFFTGHTESPPAGLEHPELQAANNASLQTRATPEDSETLIRYDIETSGFPSSHAGHLVLLRLADQDYPGAKAIEDWPSWNLPILKWAKAQGSVAGYAHCGDGLTVESSILPNYEVPPFDEDGAHEAIVDVTHSVVDFLSGGEMPPAGELNIWYHMLNCGFRLAMLGETDFPCRSDFDQRPGMGRSYVRLDRRPVDDSGYDAWLHNLQKGRLYHGDGRSHFLEFTVNGRASGDGNVTLDAAGIVDVEATIAARLEAVPTAETEAIRSSPDLVPPSWHLERARLGNSRGVEVELVVNGIAINRTAIIADGTPRRVRFKSNIVRSSWAALRILPSAHTYPVFVEIGGKAVRASKRSAQWCRNCVDTIWTLKSPFMRESERAAAAEAFDHARKTYDDILRECEVE
jgi:hypothetical protein